VEPEERVQRGNDAACKQNCAKGQRQVPGGKPLDRHGHKRKAEVQAEDHGHVPHVRHVRDLQEEETAEEGQRIKIVPGACQNEVVNQVPDLDEEEEPEDVVPVKVLQVVCRLKFFG